MMEFLGEHSTLLLAVFTVLVAFGGTWLGAKVQAGAGVAQAKASKEAAETAAAATLQAVREQADRAAEATRHAALHSQQTAAVSNLLRAVREFTRAVDRLYTDPDTAAVEIAHNDFVHAQGAVELVAPAGLSAASVRLVSTAENLADLAHDRAAAERARKHMASLDHAWEHHDIVRRARLALENYRAELETQSESAPASANEALVNVASTITGVPGLTPEQGTELIRDCRVPELGPELGKRQREHDEALSEFIHLARILLGVPS